MSDLYLPITAIKTDADGQMAVDYTDHASADYMILAHAANIGNLYECQGCGALVSDPNLHDQFHDFVSRKVDEERL